MNLLKKDGLKLKICGVATEESVDICKEIDGIDALGFIPNVSVKDVHSDMLSGEEISRLISKMPYSMESVLLIKCDVEPTVLELIGKTRPTVVQIQKEVDKPDIVAGIRSHYRNLEIIKTISVERESTVGSLLQEISVFEPYIDAVNLDAREPGHGFVHNWELSAEIVRHVHDMNLKFVLAGGLNRDNLERAIDQVRPDMEDIMTGARLMLGGKPVKRKLDAQKVMRIAEIVRKYK